MTRETTIMDSSEDDEALEDDFAPLPGPNDTPPIDFATLILSLSTTCMIQLGELEGPEGGQLDLPAARSTIEMLQVLDRKTRGNLSGEEERLLCHVLTDLRARYCAKFAS